MISCQYNKKPITVEHSSNLKSFKTFIQRFKMLPIPLDLNTSCYAPDSTNSVNLDMENDSVFIDYVGPAVTVGLFPDTTNFYAVIYCTAAECYLPTLAVFTKDGKRLSIEQISHGCGTDQGYRCTDSLIINSMTDIKSKLIEDNYKVDKDGKSISNTLSRFITIDEFAITKTGLITKKTNKINKNSY